jgi:5'-nucleotidase
MRPPFDGRLTIAFMNDTHTHLYPWKNEENGREYGGAARWATLLKNIRSEEGEILFLHAGDMLVGSDNNYLVNRSPDWERLPGYGYRGLREIPVFKMLGLDAVSFGNHEFDYGLYWNYHLFSNAAFDVLAANVTLRPIPADPLYDEPYYKPYQIYNVKGVKVGVIGLLTDEFIKTSQIRVADPVLAVTPLMEQLKKECDLTVVLSHLGIEQDRDLAAKVPGIDVIVGGHSHTYLGQPEVVNGTIITQTRCYGQFVGRLDLEYQKGVRSDYRYQLIPADFTVPEDTAVRAWLDKQRFPIILERSLSAVPAGSGTLGDYITARIGQKYPADVVLIKSGIYKGDLPAGPVSARDFFTVLWPYRPRDVGPEKELSPDQIRNLVQGKISAITRSQSRNMLNSAAGLTTLIRGDISTAVFARIEALVKNRMDSAGGTDGGANSMDGGAEYFSLRIFSVPAGKEHLSVVMDLPSWIDLYREGILDDSFQWRSLSGEIIEILCEEID